MNQIIGPGLNHPLHNNWPNYDYSRYPGQSSGTTITLQGTPFMNYPYQIRKVSNGFILNSNNEEFVFESIENLLQHLANKLNETK